MTKTLALAALAVALAGAPTLAFADPSCVAQATDKKLAGAAKTASSRNAKPTRRPPATSRPPTRSSPAPPRTASPRSASATRLAASRIRRAPSQARRIARRPKARSIENRLSDNTRGARARGAISERRRRVRRRRTRPHLERRSPITFRAIASSRADRANSARSRQRNGGSQAADDRLPARLFGDRRLFRPDGHRLCARRFSCAGARQFRARAKARKLRAFRPCRRAASRRAGLAPRGGRERHPAGETTAVRRCAQHLLVGLSEGAIAAATATGERVAARIVEGWTCHALWPEYVGLRAPAGEPTLAFSSEDDPWFQHDWTRGDCGAFINPRNGSKSIVFRAPDPLHDQHFVFWRADVQATALAFLRAHMR